MNRMRGLALALCMAVSGPSFGKEVITAAVAANFMSTMRVLADTFEQEHDVQVRLVSGSTGKHYAQIRQGAPFDVFFAADSSRPTQLERDGLALPESRFTYAEGRLVLWSPQPERVKNNGEVLQEADFRRLAIANPKLAPYGLAAQDVLERMNLWAQLQPRLVRGENISQTMQFVQSGAAELGFVALAQLQEPALREPGLQERGGQEGGEKIRGSFWVVPRTLHRPIEQQAVILNPSPAASALFSFIRSAKAQDIMRSHGYDVQVNHEQ